MNKKLVTSVVALGILFNSGIALAQENNTNINSSSDKPINERVKRDASYYEGYLWEYSKIKKDADTVTDRNWELRYVGEPCSRAGEYDAYTAHVDYTHTLSGSVSAEIKDKVQAELGYTFGVTSGESITKNSDAFERAGDYVKAYRKKCYSVSEIYEKEIHYIMNRGEYLKYEPTGKTRVIAKGKKALLPKIKFDYFHKNGEKYRMASNESNPYKTEIYEYINGKYILSEVIEN